MLCFPPRPVQLENRDQAMGSGIGLPGLEPSFITSLVQWLLWANHLSSKNISNLRYKLEIISAFLMGLLRDLWERRAQSIKQLLLLFLDQLALYLIYTNTFQVAHIMELDTGFKCTDKRTYLSNNTMTQVSGSWSCYTSIDGLSLLGKALHGQEETWMDMAHILLFLLEDSFTSLLQ